MPFHGTANYIGQLTGQYGIHGAIESSLLTEYSREVTFSHDTATISSSAFNQTIFSIESSLALVSEILAVDKEIAPEGIRGSDWEELMWNAMGEELSGRVDLAAVNTANLWFTSLVDSGMLTQFNSTDLSSIMVNLSGIPDPWRPPIPSNNSSPTTTSITVSMDSSSTANVLESTSSQKNTSWIVSPLLFLMSGILLVRRREKKYEYSLKPCFIIHSSSLFTRGNKLLL